MIYFKKDVLEIDLQDELYDIVRHIYDDIVYPDESKYFEKVKLENERLLYDNNAITANSLTGIINSTTDNLVLKIPDGYWDINFTYTVKYYNKDTDGNYSELYVDPISFTDDQNAQEITFTGSYVFNGDPVYVYVYFAPNKAEDYLELHASKQYVFGLGMREEASEVVEYCDLYNIARYCKLRFKSKYIDYNRPFAYPSYPNSDAYILENDGYFNLVLNMLSNNREFYDPALYIQMLKIDIGQYDEIFKRRNPVDGALYATSNRSWSAYNTEYLAIGDSDPKMQSLRYGAIQSYIIQCDYRSTSFHYLKYDEKLDQIVLNIDNYEGAKAELIGNYNKGKYSIDDNKVLYGSCFTTIKAYQAPIWENNFAPRIPIYMGKIEHKEIVTRAIFGGSTYRTLDLINSLEDMLKKSGSYDFDDPTVRFDKYDLGLGNGIDDVIVEAESEDGHYKGYYLEWLAPPNEMQPDRMRDSDGAQYPDAYMQSDNEDFNFKFNPSRYTGEVFASLVDLFRVDKNGDFDETYTLNNFIGVPSISLIDEDILRVKKDRCDANIYDDYRYFTIEGISPLTKRPSTQYRSVGVGIQSTP